MDEGNNINTTLSSNTVSTDTYDPYNSEISDVERYIETVVLSIITVVAAVAKGSLWVVILHTRSLRQQSSMLLLLCVSLANTLVSCVSMPITVITIAMARWVYGEATCTVMGFVNMLTLVSSVMSLGLVSINRYVKICCPITTDVSSRCHGSSSCLSACGASPPYCPLPHCWAGAAMTTCPAMTTCFCDWSTSISYTFFMVLVCFGGPLSMMTICNVRILQTFRKTKLNLQQQQHVSAVPGTPKEERGSQSPVIEAATPPVVDEPSPSLEKSSPSPVSVRFKPVGTCLHTDSVEAKPESSSVSGHDKPAETCLQDDSVEAVPDEGVDSSHLIAMTTSLELSSESGSSSISSNDLPGSSSVSGHYKPAETCLQDGSVEAVPDKEVGILHLIAMTTSPEPSPEPGGRSTPSNDLPEARNSATSLPKQGLNVLNVAATNGRECPRPQPATRQILQQRLKDKRRMEEFQLALSLMVVVAVFVICWLPFCITMFISVFMPHALPRPADMFTLLLGYSNSCFNPIFYGIRNKRVKEGYKSLWTFICNCCVGQRSADRRTGRTTSTYDITETSNINNSGQMLN